MEIQNQANLIRKWFLSKVLDTSPVPHHPPSALAVTLKKPPTPTSSLSLYYSSTPQQYIDCLPSSTDIKTEEDLLPPGAEPGTVATDLDQSTGLERFEILGKMQGIDVFDMKPLDASRKGTELASTSAKSFTIVDETTLIGTTLCECGHKTWRACVGGGWCWLDGTWGKEGTKTGRELTEWTWRTMMRKEPRECGKD